MLLILANDKFLAKKKIVVFWYFDLYFSSPQGNVWVFSESDRVLHYPGTDTYNITIDGETLTVTIIFSNSNNTFNFIIAESEIDDGNTIEQTITFTANRV